MKERPIRPVAAVRRRSERLVAGIPFDLLAVVCFVAIATALVSVLEVSSTLVRATIGMPLLFFVPGYVIVSTLFPRATPVTGDTRMVMRQARELSDVERAALSVGLSFVVLPPLGLAIAHSPWSFTGPVVVSAVTCFAVLGAAVATVRRLLVPASERYRVGFRRRFGAVRTAVFGHGSTLHAAVTVALVLSMVLAVTVIGYAFVSPQQGEQYTNLQLLSEDEGGELVSSGYPEEIEPGESIPLVISLDNREGEAMNYTVVVQEQRLEDGDVVERTELQRFSTVVDDGETAAESVTFEPTATAGDVRISVMVFTDAVPETPTRDDAYRFGHIWTTVIGDTDVGADTDLESGDGENETDGGDETESNETDSGDETESNETDSGDETETNETDSGDETESNETDSGDETETNETDGTDEEADTIFDFGDDDEGDDESGGDAGDDEDTDGSDGSSGE